MREGVWGFEEARLLRLHLDPVALGAGLLANEVRRLEVLHHLTDNRAIAKRQTTGVGINASSKSLS